MIETLKKTILAGLGAAVVTKDKVQEGLEDFVKQGKISAADARAMAERIAEEGKREFEQVSAKVGEKVRDVLASADRKYVARIEALEARLDALEKTPKVPKHRSKD